MSSVDFNGLRRSLCISHNRLIRELLAAKTIEGDIHIDSRDLEQLEKILDDLRVDIGFIKSLMHDCPLGPDNSFSWLDEPVLLHLEDQ